MSSHYKIWINYNPQHIAKYKKIGMGVYIKKIGMGKNRSAQAHGHYDFKINENQLLLKYVIFYSYMG